MPQCPTCGRTLDDAARFCPNDGTTVKPDVAAPLFSRDAIRESSQREDSVLGGGPVTIDGRYRISSRLGHGGVGAVYAGEHVETKRPVAIKVLHAVFAGSDEFHKRFEREARAASKLTHPSCVSVLDYGRVERVEPVSAGQKLLGTPYLVMEFVRGRSLVERVGKPMPPAEAIVIARGVLSALKHAHGLGIVHRDVKPANVMLVDGGGTGHIVKLLDFGLAKMAGDADADADAPLTQAGMVFGTPGYLSPEQASGHAADARSDLYALGIMLYELVAGRRPFLRADPLDVVRDHLNTLPPPPRSLGAPISPELEQVILKALAKEPRGRFASAEEFSQALAEVPELRAPLTPSQPLPSQPEPQAIATAPTMAPTTSLKPPSAKADLQEPAPRTIAIDRRTLIGGAIAIGSLLVVLLLVLLLRHPASPVIVTTPPPPPTPPPAPMVNEGGQRHLAQAQAYQRKLWCSDAIEELDKALRDDPGLRSDGEVTRIAVACLTPKTRDKATRFLVEKVGAPAKEQLEAAAQQDGNSEIRRGATLVLERLR